MSTAVESKAGVLEHHVPHHSHRDVNGGWLRPIRYVREALGIILKRLNRYSRFSKMPITSSRCSSSIIPCTIK